MGENLRDARASSKWTRKSDGREGNQDGRLPSYLVVEPSECG